jgi:hypothetical protein
LELLVTLMLVRLRRPPTGPAGGVQHAALGAAVTALPSGLLALVGEAITKQESQLEARAPLFRRAACRFMLSCVFVCARARVCLCAIACVCA